MNERQLLKKDLFGEVWQIEIGGDRRILRETAAAHWTLRFIARYLMRREAKALLALEHISAVPRLLEINKAQLQRGFLNGTPLYERPEIDAKFFDSAMRLLRRMHTAGVNHNDLAKEPNVLVLDSGETGIHRFSGWRHSTLAVVAYFESLQERTYAIY